MRNADIPVWFYYRSGVNTFRIKSQHIFKGWKQDSINSIYLFYQKYHSFSTIVAIMERFKEWDSKNNQLHYILYAVILGAGQILCKIKYIYFEIFHEIHYLKQGLRVSDKRTRSLQIFRTNIKLSYIIRFECLWQWALFVLKQFCIYYKWLSVWWISILTFISCYKIKLPLLFLPGE